MSLRLLTVLSLVLCVSLWAAETYEIEKWAVGAVGLGWAGFGAALAGPTEYLINPAGLGAAERSYLVINSFFRGVQIKSITSNYNLGIQFIKPMRTESASIGEERTLGTLAVSLNEWIYSDVYSEDNNIIGENESGTESLADISFGSSLKYGL